MHFIRRHLTVLFLAAGLHSASAFSLLGPFEPWMTTNLSFNNYWAGLVDIGGPKSLGEGYRWNIPVITYGYDQSFLDYFGSNGVVAVESAIQVLNDVPPASETNLNSFPLDTSLINYDADQQNLYDLKTAALGLIVEQLGLASPSRFAYTLQNTANLEGAMDMDLGAYYDFTNLVFLPILEEVGVTPFNYDPVTLVPSPYINGILYTYYILAVSYFNVAVCEIYPVDPVLQRPDFNTVADYAYNFDEFHQRFGDIVGVYYAGLTRDDVGGLCYLYGTNNFALESLVPGVHGAERDARHFVNLAVRPGVGKITFQRLDYDERRHRFRPLTLHYEDSYLTNGTLRHQELEREIKRPDILFTAEHLGLNEFSRTGTSNWVNNGAPSQYGPGVIQPPVAINFGKFGPTLYHNGALYSGPADIYVLESSWASFDGSTNPPIRYPTDSSKNKGTEIYFQLEIPPALSGEHTMWTLSGEHNEVFNLQTSTNMSDWAGVIALTNTGQDVNYIDYALPNVPQRFFRVVPQ